MSLKLQELVSLTHNMQEKSLENQSHSIVMNTKLALRAPTQVYSNDGVRESHSFASDMKRVTQSAILTLHAQNS